MGMMDLETSQWDAEVLEMLELAGGYCDHDRYERGHPYGHRCPEDGCEDAYGLTLSHERKHMIRAAMEGVVYNLYSVYLALREQMDSVSSIKASGGFARSEMWIRDVDQFGKRI